MLSVHEWESVADVIRRNLKNMIVRIEGEVIDVSENTYKKKTGEEMKEQIVTILQRPKGLKKELVEIKLPFDLESPSIGSEFSELVSVSFWGSGFSRVQYFDAL